MAGLGSILGGVGQVAGSAYGTYTGAQEQQRKQQEFELLRQQRLMEMAQKQQAFEQQKIQQQRQQQSAAILAGILGSGQNGVPMNTGIPGATPMPQSGGQQPNSGTMVQPPSQGAPVPQRLPQAVPGGGGAPMPPMPAQQPNMGGGMTAQQLAQRIAQQYGEVDPMTMLDVIGQYQNLLKPDEQQQYKQIQLQIQQLRAETQSQGLAERERMDDWRMRHSEAGGAADKTAKRELHNMALRYGIDPNKFKSDEELESAIAAKSSMPKPEKLTAGEKRAASAATDVDKIIGDIQEIINSHPAAIGIYGRGAGIGGEVAGLIAQDAPDDAKAAAALKPLFTKLEQRLGVLDSAGGQGGAGFAKQWASTIGAGDIFQTPELLMDTLNGIKGDVGAYKGGDRESPSNVPQDVDPKLWQYMTPEEKALWQTPQNP